tara:strand:+ start:9592 stop:9882 length:291 start_codon:yes stop_codon:yes gene_type:complete
MLKTRKIRVGKKYIQAVSFKLCKKTLIVLRGSKGYIMCGYLKMKVANSFSDVAVKITGISTINQALSTRVYSQSMAAKKLGIYRNQPIKDVIKIIA